MDTPICVIDAKTLVDRIQDLKRWIYHGQLHLIVPLSSKTEVYLSIISPINIKDSAIEHVEQLYQKSTETKPATQEPARPKSSGKLTRREYPAFDINPRVARSFLTRLKTWKEEDAVSEQRAFFREKENHDAVEFQQPTEQYTPWKDVEAEEETPEPVVDRPTTWAEALRKKRNLANGISELPEAPKGAAKPKLVARSAGSDPSPWKIKRDAPKISAKDVPGALRPLMSCALWRLHESIHRNDANQLFLFSDQAEIRSVAQKLNIVVRSISELNALINSRLDRSDVLTVGDLEREFGLQQKDTKTPSTGLTQKYVEEKGVGKEVNDNVTEKVEKSNESVPIGELSKVGDSQSIDDSNHEGSENDIREPPRQSPENGCLYSAIADADGKIRAEHVSQTPKVTLVESKAPMVSAWSKPLADLTYKRNSDDALTQVEDAHRVDGAKSGEISRTSSRSVFEREGQQSTETCPNSATPTIGSPQEEPVKSTHSEQAPQLIDHSTPPPPNALHTPSGQTAREPEDSDEEEIVFKPQPKRYSAQKKPSQQSSRPSTPKSQPTQKPEERSPQASTPKIPPQPQPKPASHARNPMVIGHGHPQPKGSPTVIDPDAFGRNFVVNTHPGPRTLHSHRAHHYPRPNPPSSQSTQVPRSPRRPNPRSSPPRHLQENGHRAPTAPEPNAEQIPRTSPHRRFRAAGPVSGPARDAEPVVSISGLHASLPAPKPIETDESALEPSNVKAPMPDTRPTPSINRSRDYQSAGFGHHSQTSQSMPEASVSGPKVFESSDFVPRSAVITPLYKSRAPEPDYIEPRASMPDVEYVLKSGTTRASARGRGRLWTPS